MPHSSVSLDVSDKEIKLLSIGDTVEATIKGRIVSLEKGHEFESHAGGLVSSSSTKKKKKEVTTILPSVRVELTSVKVTQPNKFSALVDDSDEED